MAVKYFHLGEGLYYRILESIIEREKMILGDADLSVNILVSTPKPATDRCLSEALGQQIEILLCVCVSQCILEQDVFHRSLLVCCLEIVIFSYRPPGDFPNLIDIFQLPAYHFYKVSIQLISSVRMSVC